MLGAEIIRAAKENNIQVDDHYVDILSVQPSDIHSDIVINCSGVSPDVHNRKKLIEANQHGPIKLAKACDDACARLIHMSTDAVYNSPGPHNERSRCSPSSAYGRTKMKGEIKYVPHLTIRTSFIGFGKRGIISQLLNTDEKITASTLYLWSGHTASAIADIIIELVHRNDITGLIHIPGEFQTRYDVAMKLVRLFGLDESRIIRDDSWISDRRLISSRWYPAGLPTMPLFDKQLEKLAEQHHENILR